MRRSRVQFLSPAPSFSLLPKPLFQHSYFRVFGWVSVIEAFPSRIMSALDLGGDRMDEIHKKVEVLRSVISELSKSTKEWVAYKAAWTLLLDEDLFLETT